MPTAVGVHCGSVQVPRRTVHPSNALPSRPDGEESVLGQLLGVMDAPGDEVDGPEELAALCLEELFERNGGRGGRQG
jgi:hypothetical protein